MRKKVSSENGGSHNRLYAADERISELEEITQNEKRVRERWEI